jgi:drug/metabolite transporter (DMT)-like permease
MLYSSMFLHEHFGRWKLFALLLAVVGTALIGKIYDLEGAQVSLLGLFAGLGAGIGYACYILFNKAALQRNYQPWTINAYALGMGALWMIPLLSHQGFNQFVIPPTAFPWLILLGIIPTLGGSLAFNLGLQRISATNASIVATLEPLIAILLGWIFFAEQLEFPQLCGGLCIVASVIILQTKSKS